MTMPMSGSSAPRFADSWVQLLSLALESKSQTASDEGNFLRQLVHVDPVGSEVPEHLNQLVWEGVEVDVEFAVCGKQHR